MRRLLFAAVLLAGCAAQNSLEGSLSDQVSLEFTSVRIERGEHEVAVAYLDSVSTAGDDTVMKIVANIDGVDLSKGGEVDLNATVTDGSKRGSITRAVHDDSRREFPALVRGKLSFDSNPKVGAENSGSFSLLFDQGGQLGAGRTAFGDFAGNVVEAGK
jgi:hypothetical protein